MADDLTWSGMIGDGDVTDMVNLTRAKDAALALVYAAGRSAQ